MTESRDLMSSILAANKGVAKELVGKLLPTVLSETSRLLFSDSSLWKQNAVYYERNRKQMEAKIADRRHFFKRKSPCIEVHRQLWKEDQL
jgi:hypothetical protein